MQLDGMTLMAAGSFIAAMCGFLILGTWTHSRAAALLWWAAASLIDAVGIGALGFGITTGNVPAIVSGSFLNALAPVLTWAGVRSFNRRRQLPLWLAAGPAVFLLSGLLPVPLSDRSSPLSSWVSRSGSSISPRPPWELWRSRKEELPARLPLISFMGLHVFVFLGGMYDVLTGSRPAEMLPPLSSWFAMIYFEGLIYAIGSTTFMVLLCRERIERRSIEASLSDSLTGIANRGAFLNAAGRALRRCQADATSFSLIMFDLDRFKWINDTFGHDVGDRVLRTFTESTASVLRPNDLFGRYGGEEFVVVLPGATVEAAYVIAERIRHRFAEAGAFTDDHPTRATVSAGVAGATSISTLDTVMRAADQSMYRAKRLGRNRVERVPLDRDDEEAETIIRIA